MTSSKAQEHGYGAYSNGRCRCGVCRKAKADYVRDRRRNARLTVGPDPVPGIKHGRVGYEEHGCRCDVCKAARTVGRGDRKARYLRAKAREAA